MAELLCCWEALRTGVVAGCSLSGWLEVTEVVDSGDKTKEFEGRAVIPAWLTPLRTPNGLLQTKNPPKSHPRLCFGKRERVCNAWWERGVGWGLHSQIATGKEPSKPTHGSV